MKLATLAIIFCCSASLAHAESGLASWYAPGVDHVGHQTASGENFTGREMTAAHRRLPFGTMAHVCRGSNCITVRINDRGPFVRGRIIDLSRTAAAALGCLSLCPVTVTP